MNQLGAVLVRLAESGSDNLDKATKRRVIIINALMMVIILMSLIYLTALSLLDFWGFRYVILWLAAVSPFFLITLKLWTFHVHLGSVYNLALWTCYGMVLTYLLSRESGIHFLFLGGTTVSILIFGIRVNSMSIFSMTVGLTNFAIAHLTFIEPASWVTASPAAISSLFFLSILIFIMVIFSMVYYAFYQLHKAENLLEQEYAYSEGLLNAVMPKTIADQLKLDRHKTIADGYDTASILFADLAGFTASSSKKTPQEVIGFLNQLFTRFDALVAKHGVEKIKTLGDSYMAAGGMPEKSDDHAERIAALALDMQESAKELSAEMNEKFHLRIGFHTGPAVAGVIGAEKPFYDVWGDTVNTASRLESYGANDTIQVTKATRDLLKGKFEFARRGLVEMKGKGQQEVWILKGPKT